MINEEIESLMNKVIRLSKKKYPLKKGRFKVLETINKRQKVVSRKGYTIGLFGVGIGSNDQWQVTHLPTMKALRKSMTKPQALKLARIMNQSKKWDTTDVPFLETFYLAFTHTTYSVLLGFRLPDSQKLRFTNQLERLLDEKEISEEEIRTSSFRSKKKTKKKVGKKKILSKFKKKKASNGSKLRSPDSSKLRSESIVRRYKKAKRRTDT